MIQSIIQKEFNGNHIPDFNDMDADSRLKIVYLLLISGCDQVKAAINEKLLADHVLGNLIMSLNYCSNPTRIYAMNQFEADVIASLEPIIQDGIDQFNLETSEIKSITGDACTDAGHKQSDFS